MKVTSVVVLAVLVVQLAQGSPVIESRNNQEILVEAVLKMKQVIKSELNEIQYGIQYLMQEINKAFNMAKQNVTKALTDAIDKIQIIEETAQAHGTDPTKCVEPQREKIYKLVEESLTKLKKTAKATTSSMIKTSSDIEHEFQVFEDATDYYLQQFNNCSSVQCEEKVVGNALTHFAEIKGTVKELVALTSSSIVNLTFTSLSIFEDISINHEYDSRHLVKAISQCINTGSIGSV